MGVLRDLVTRFSFDVNKKDVNKYDKTIKGMSSKALKLGAVFGGAFTVKGLVESGLSAERAVFNLKRLAGTDFSKLQNMLKQTRAELNGIKEGSGDLITDKNFNLSAANFIEEFGRGNDALKLFNTLLSFSSKQSALTGKNINEMMGALQQSIKTGDFSILKQLPEFDQVSINLFNELNKIFDPGELGGRIGLQQKSSKLSSFLKRAESSQVKSLAKLPDSILEANRAAKNFQNTLDKTGKSFNKVVTPAVDYGSRQVQSFGDFVDEAESDSYLDAYLKRVLSKKGYDFVTGKSESETNEIVPAASGQINRAGFNINNTFNITTDDPRKAASIAVQKMNEEIRKARSQLVPTEER